ncbi:hypothetical protein NPIL_219571 [Nephila pilipes]|uniref:Uncharacterized protein n=1 Tax=Nephila pilipes TaxID=299642 RepID=A0A8X6NRQ7_NEPPI|nr:hypothetical protein NPIL_219571 [Nephila pilipes]
MTTRLPRPHKFNVRGRFAKCIDNPRTFDSATCNEKVEAKCFSLYNFGHVVRDCPFPYSLCGESEHHKRYCKKNKNEPRASTLSVCDRESSALDKYLKTAHINNHMVTALLVTRSSCYLLNELVANNLGLNISPCEKDIFFLVSVKPSLAKLRYDSDRF